MQTFEKRTTLPVPREMLFAYHDSPGALERLLPPFQTVRVEKRGRIRDGETVVLRMGPGPMALRWVARHHDFVQGERFSDTQDRGPFAHWVHTHRFLDAEPGHSILEDEIEYALPFGTLGSVFGSRFARRTLERMFAFRHARTRNDLVQLAAHPMAPSCIAVSGATGLVGRALCAYLEVGGHRVRRITRSPGPGDIGWNPGRGELDAAALEGVDAVVHLAGESIASLRWTAAKKRAILDSRVLGTRLLAEAIPKLASPPRTFVSASAVGYYGDRGDERVNEESTPGEGFLADVCRAWEAECAPLERAGLRVVRMRIGAVLAARGGALAAQLPLFRLGLGGPVGGGEQFISWIALDDLVYAIAFALAEPGLSGAVNATAPTPVSNRAFARTLGHVLGRPAVLPQPAFALRLGLGEMASELLLSGAYVAPDTLKAAGFTFGLPDLESALRLEIGA